MCGTCAPALRGAGMSDALPPEHGDAAKEEPASVLDVALRAVLQAQQLLVAVEADAGLEDDAHLQVARLQLGASLLAAEARLRAALTEENRMHVQLASEHRSRVAAEESLAEARAEAEWLKDELAKTSEQLSAASNMLYLQVVPPALHACTMQMHCHRPHRL